MHIATPSKKKIRLLVTEEEDMKLAILPTECTKDNLRMSQFGFYLSSEELVVEKEKALRHEGSNDIILQG